VNCSLSFLLLADTIGSSVSSAAVVLICFKVRVFRDALLHIVTSDIWVTLHSGVLICINSCLTNAHIIMS